MKALLGLALSVSIQAVPRVDIVYPPFGTIFDKTCASFAAEPKATPERIAAAGKLRPRLAEEWAKYGPQYMRAALGEVGAPFPYEEMQAVLSVCGVGTMSMPLMIDVRQYLPDSERPAPAGDFSEKLFHELMHHYVSGLTADSPLRKKYESESPVVLNHLHVMALEKVVLTKLGYASELKFLDEEYRTENGPYKRAWQIVNEIESPEAFVKELKAAVRNRPPSRPSNR
jgi:hypothetical protein